MKKLAFFSCVLLAVAAASCNSGKLKEAETQNAQLDDSLKVALENQDSLFSLLNDITAGMEQIKSMEQLLSSSPNLSSESQSRREAIKNDMALLQQALQNRRERLAELESRLSKSTANNQTLRKTIENLKASLSEQSGTIENLRRDLASAHIEIERLDSTVSSLNAAVDTISAAKAVTDEQLANTTNELNKVYYVFGTKSELKEHNIIEGGGFLRKTKIMESDFDQSYFTTADRRELTYIPLYAKKAKIMTKQPDSSYELVDDSNGQKVLKITNPDDFWKLSNYLVIQTD